MTLMDKFIDRISPEPNSGCWLWTGYRRAENLYGTLKIRGKLISAHRISYELFKGKIPEGKQIDHLCRVRICVNPDHLEAVTCKENILRGEGVCGNNARKTQCVNGHEFDDKNTYMRPTGGRMCKMCCRIRDRKRKEAKKKARMLLISVL